LSFYAFIKRWQLPSLLRGCNKKNDYLYFTKKGAFLKHAPIVFGHLGTFILVLGCFPFDSGPYQPLSDFFPLNLWFF